MTQDCPLSEWTTPRSWLKAEEQPAIAQTDDAALVDGVMGIEDGSYVLDVFDWHEESSVCGGSAGCYVSMSMPDGHARDVSLMCCFQFCGDVNAATNRSRHGAKVGMHLHDALCGFLMLSVEIETVLYMNALDDEDPTLFLDLTLSLTRQKTITCRYPARFQRASKGSDQSPGGS